MDDSRKIHDAAKEQNDQHQAGSVSSELEALARAMIGFWEEISESATEGNDSLNELTNALRRISANPVVRPASMPSVERLLGDIGNLDENRRSSGAFNRALAQASSLIHWYPNNVYEDLSEAAELDNYCSNIVGMERNSQNNPFLFHSEEVLVGLFLLGPNRLYPAHAHAAPEMWVILSGTAQWKRGSEPWRVRKPGEYFIHASNQPHAMRTLDEPLFALWAWTGDLEQWARWVQD